MDEGSRTLAWKDRGGAIVDVVAFGVSADRGLAGDPAALQEAAGLYQGELLPECGEWIEPDRERLLERAKQVYKGLVAYSEDQRAFGDAIRHAQQLLRLDPLDEEAWCALMRSHARRGERAAALHVYQQCAAVLKKELGIQPSAATRVTYREVLDLDAAAPAVPTPPRTAVYPLVGRRREWQSLVDAWRLAAEGNPGIVLIRGEAGIGKTRLAEELLDWCSLNRVTAVTARCYAGEGRLAYAPVAAWLRSDAMRPALMKLDSAWTTDVARLLPELLAARSEVPAPQRQLESWERLRFFDALVQAFRLAAPAVLVIDDLQWADADTIEWLQFFVRSASGASCLIAATVRAEEEQDNPPLVRFRAALEQRHQLKTVDLGPLDVAATAALAGAVAEAPLDEASAARAFADTEGHPLFIVERGRMEQGSSDGLAHVQSVVAARLGLLSDAARATAEIAAAVGREFRFDVLAHASDFEESALVHALDELWRRQIVRVQGDEQWDFTHDRIREVAYSGIGPARRRLIHRRIAQAMELLCADRLDAVSASIAMHLERGGQAARAVPFLDRAAAVAMRLSANEEAIRCLTHAVSLLEDTPPGPERDDRELALRTTLSGALNSARGYAAPELEANLDRVFALARSPRDGQVPVRWLWAAFTLRFMLGDLARTREVAEQALAESETDPTCRCEAHHAMGGALLSLGEVEASCRHFEAALAAYNEADPQRSAFGSDLGVFAHAWSSHALWVHGDEAAAVAHAEQAIALARRRQHLYSETLALAYAALLHQMRLDTPRVIECAEAAVALCERYGFAYYGDWATTLLGWARGQERPAEGVEIMTRALERLDAMRAQARRPYYLSLLADVHRRGGHDDRARSVLDAGIRMALERGDVWWLPMLYVQSSELETSSAREALYRRGLELARTHQSSGLERRILERTLSRTI